MKRTLIAGMLVLATLSFAPRPSHAGMTEILWIVEQLYGHRQPCAWRGTSPRAITIESAKAKARAAIESVAKRQQRKPGQ